MAAMAEASILHQSARHCSPKAFAKLSAATSQSRTRSNRGGETAVPLRRVDRDILGFLGCRSGRSVVGGRAVFT
jgi:hypothetical protein